MKDMVTPQRPLRAPQDVMRLARMGVMMPTRLSFLRVLTRRLCAERAQVQRTHWDMCADGFGTAVHQVTLGGRTYALISVSKPLDDSARSDRVIATAWDAAFVLFDGVPSAADIARVATQAPRQEAGRFGPRDLVLSRANKSMRLWSEIVAALRAGHQPAPARIGEIGYIMRTTAVYGNGKFGIADRHLVADRPELSGAFAAEMLAVYLIRQFSLDLVQHVGRGTLDRALARHIGVGNATGLGMAPFLVTHPVLLNNWMVARETALARVRAVPDIPATTRARITTLAARVAGHLSQWHVPGPEDEAALRALEAEWAAFRHHLDDLPPQDPYEHVWSRAQDHSVALQELVVALLLEVNGDIIDGLAECMVDPFGAPPQPFAGTAALRDAIGRDWGWALDIDFDDPDACRRFWYVSADKLEPRLGDRFAEDGAELETPLDIARRVAQAHADLPRADQPVSAFLRDFPQHKHAIDRIAICARHPYSEIRDNLIATTCRPIDMLRCKLSFFGATKFDPKSDLWTRITLAQGAPLGDELTDERDDWWLPVMSV
ncbi:MAG: hypothetical protein AAFZ99_13565 [Pseudomonadota bacterium]